jgi:hypothetical protein
MDDVILGHPLAQVAGQKHRGLAVEIDEACGHENQMPSATGLFNFFSKMSPPQSPTGC